MPTITTPFTLTRSGNHIILNVDGEIVIWRQQNVLLTKNSDDTLTLTDQITSFTMSFSDSLNPVATTANGFLIAVSKIINEQSLLFTAFGEQEIAQITPVIQLEFPALINPRITSSTLVGTGTNTVVDSMATTSSGTTTGSSARLASVKFLKYRPGQGVETVFSCLYTTGVASTLQEVGILGITNGFGFGYDGDEFGILHRNNGVNTWTGSTNWSVDKADGTGVLPALDPTTLNVYRVSYAGYNGTINFGIEDSESGFLVDVHQIKYTNSNTVPAVTNASLPFSICVDNLATTSDLIVQCASAMCSVQGIILGQQPDSALTNAFSNTFSGVNQTIDTVFQIRSKTSFGGAPNNIEAVLKRISIGTDGTGICIIEVFQNATTTAPTWVDVDATSSIMETDILGTAITGGDLIYSTILQKADASSEIVSELNIVMAPGDILSFAATTFSGTNDVTIAANWTEQF